MAVVFTRLADANLTMKLDKCEFGQATVALGKGVGQGEVCPITAKVEAIIDFCAPMSCHELK